MDIVYLKLRNGDELFANRISEEGNLILLDNVMVMETIHTDNDMKYLFMTRYTQYCDIHSLSLDRSLIVFIGEASEIVKKHYLISVRYAEQMSDARFYDGIADASKYLTKVLGKNETGTEDSFASNSTKH